MLALPNVEKYEICLVLVVFVLFSTVHACISRLVESGNCKFVIIYFHNPVGSFYLCDFQQFILVTVFGPFCHKVLTMRITVF